MSITNKTQREQKGSEIAMTRWMHVKRLINILYLVTAAVILISAANPSPKNKRKQEISREQDLTKASFKEILDRYVFVADFNQKPAERNVSKEFLWKYPLKPPPVQFPLDLNLEDLRTMIFQVRGIGPKVEGLNVGRVAYMQGDHDLAHAIWLQGRQEFKDDVATNKIFEFYMGVNALTSYKKKLDQKNVDENDQNIKGYLQRAAYFFAATYILRRDVPDERITVHAPWALYNLAVIYHRFDRMPSVYGAATEGLSVLLSQGKTLHRAQFRQLLAEAHIKNQDPVSAIQELDTAIRQDPDPAQAARIFNRAADIYYDFNNYELASDLYGLASAIDRERMVYNPGHAMLRGESEFWLGRFAEAERLLMGAADYSLKMPGSDWLHRSGMMPWVWLRIADTKLVRSATASAAERKKLQDQARLAYFKVQTEFPKTEASRIAEVRGACMEMPKYEGQNVKHARELLADVKEKKDIPEILMELVWACDAGSYSQREKTDRMVDKIKEFSDKYPNSKFLDDMIPPVREVNASKIDEYFDKKNWEEATDFFEQKRSTLFSKVSPKLAANLWEAYVSTSRSADAIEYWPQAVKSIQDDSDALRQAAFLFEAVADKKGSKLRADLTGLNKKLMTRKWRGKPSPRSIQNLSRVYVTKDAHLGYVWMMNIADSWSAGDEDALCSVIFPLLSRVTADRHSTAQAKNAVLERLTSRKDDEISAIKDSGCKQSWIDLEARVLGKKVLEKKYAARAAWPLEGAWLERLWTWSEELNTQGRREDAKSIWKRIAEKAPSDSFEAKMAKTRLDPRKTEYESLWR
jgi:tetratricopeptide (TPR) repeat protein